ncbi:MAG TPA: hypothetical protein VGM37_05495 [Armatimonadota bacterium]
MDFTDPKNPLNYILPAGVIAYVASPEVRKSVRTAVVKGVASVMDVLDKAEGASEGVRQGFQGIVDDARKMRDESKESPIRVDVANVEPPAGAESAAA